MKVLFITPAYYPNLRGGSERSLKIITEGLKQKGINVTVLSFDAKNKEITRLNNNTVMMIVFMLTWNTPRNVMIINVPKME